VDQRKIFMFAREFLPKVGYEKRIHLMNPMIPGLGESGKMSSSEPNSKIDFEDDDAKIKSKINKAFSIDGAVEGNGLLAICKYIVFKQLERDARPFVIERPEKYGGNIEFGTYAEVEEAFASKKLSSIDLKSGLAGEIVKIVAPLREKLSHKKELIAKAYPEE
jgi:tyrosyl-tRNA synthetase